MMGAVTLRHEARELKRKAISSMRVTMTAFNSPQDDGRVTAVLLHLQHAFEMLLKAALVQDRVPRVLLPVGCIRPRGAAGNSEVSG
jgi:hypothetical protein